MRVGFNFRKAQQLAPGMECSPIQAVSYLVIARILEVNRVARRNYEHSRGLREQRYLCIILALLSMPHAMTRNVEYLGIDTSE